MLHRIVSEYDLMAACNVSSAWPSDFIIGKLVREIINLPVGQSVIVTTQKTI